MLEYDRLDWLRILVSPRGSFSSGVVKRVAFFGFLATLVWLAHSVYPRVVLPLGVHELAGAFIALVLAFRTNTSYARFWEGRTLWGAIVNSSRNVTRIAAQHSSASPAALRELAVWVVVFAHATRRSLRGEGAEPELEHLLAPSQLEATLSAAHPPLYAAAQVSALLAAMVRRGELEPNMAARAEAQVCVLLDCLGGCERIRNTPTPLGYVQLLERSLVLLLASLPFAIVVELGKLTPLVSMMVAYPVMMIEGLGRELDDPFGHDPNDLPLTRICDTIEHNLLGTSSQQTVMASSREGAVG